MAGYTEKDWQDAGKKCHLNHEDIRKAKKPGMTPKSLVKNIPGKKQPWKAPVKEWIRELYAETFEADEKMPF